MVYEVCNYFLILYMIQGAAGGSGGSGGGGGGSPAAAEARSSVPPGRTAGAAGWRAGHLPRPRAPAQRHELPAAVRRFSGTDLPFVSRVTKCGRAHVPLLHVHLSSTQTSQCLNAVFLSLLNQRNVLLYNVRLRIRPPSGMSFQRRVTVAAAIHRMLRCSRMLCC